MTLPVPEPATERAAAPHAHVAVPPARFNLSRFAIDHPWSTGAFWTLVAICGAVAFANLKFSLLPDIALPVVVVIAHDGRLDAAATERELTIPLERVLEGSKPEALASTTYPGRAILRLTYPFGNTLDRNAADVRAQLARSPTAVRSGATATAIDLNESAVSVYAVPFSAANSRGVARAIRSRVVPAFASIASVKRVELLGLPGQPSAARLNGKAVVEVRIVKRAGANALEVARESDAVVARLGSRFGVPIVLAASQAPYIRSASHATLEALVIAMLLAALVTFPFLRDPRATAISALAIPVSLAGAAIVMALVHFNLEMITLVALALVAGVIVDDAIVDVENISRHISRGEPAREAAAAATDEIWLAASAATLTIVAVFLPIGLTSGNFGQFFKPFGLTASAAVLTSLAVARTLSPMLASRVLVRPPGPRPPGPLSRAYGRTLAAAIGHPKTVVACAAASFVAGLALIPLIPRGFIPHLDRGDFVVYVDAPPGTTAAAFAAKTRALETAILRDRDVRSVLTSLGGQDEPGHGRLDVLLRADRHATTLDVEDRVRRALPAIAGYTTSVEDTQFVERGQTKPLRLILSAPDRGVADRAGRRLRATLAATPGFVDVTRTASDEMLGAVMRSERFDAAYAAYVDADLNGRSIGDATAYAIDLAHRTLPPSVRIHLGGESQTSTNTLRGFSTTLWFSIASVVVVLGLLFRGWRAPLVILVTMPLSLLGALIALLITRTDFGILSLLGLIFLLGLTGKNAILLVDAIERRRAAAASFAGAIVEAAAVRLRPILMTTAATILGMLPIALGFGAGAELRAPMAVTIIGGLIASTLLTLIVVPAAYVLVKRS